MAATIQLTVTNAGGNVVLDGTNFLDGTTIEVFAASGVVLAANWHLEISPAPINGTMVNILVVLNNDLDLNGFTFDISGQFFSQEQIAAYGVFKGFQFYDASFLSGNNFITDFMGGGYLEGSHLLAGTVPLTALENLTSGRIIVGNGSNIPTAVAVTGDVTISNAGVTAIGAGVIVNADINASAAIAVSKLAAMTATKLVTTDGSGFITTGGSGVIVNADINASAAIALSKLAALTASKVVVTNGSGVITTANQVSAALGGTGIDNSAATGFPVWAAGSQSVGAMTFYVRVDISFVTAAQGTYYVKVPAGTITAAKARVTSTVSGTDDGTITLKDAGGTNMTGGLITIPASSAHGTGVAVTITANNTATAGQEIQLLVAKTTSGGQCSVDITITRSALT